MVRRCVAALCSNVKTDTISLHHWPQDPKVAAQWTKFVMRKRANWKGPTKSSELCSAHFEPSSFDQHIDSMLEKGFAKYRKLLPTAVPTLWNVAMPEQKKSRKAAEKRQRARVSSIE